MLNTLFKIEVLYNKTSKYIINKDKASNYKTFNMNKELSKINIDNNKLIELLHYSYDKFPRIFLFEKNNNKISDQQILTLLRKITNIEKININMMRSICHDIGITLTA